MLKERQRKRTKSTKKINKVNDWLIELFLHLMEGRTKKNRPTQSENRLGFRGELMEFNHSLAGYFFSRFLLVGLFSLLVQKKENFW
jgi:hypothetical protein